jgi:V/A-type H+-transporting ATPase subunit C
LWTMSSNHSPNYGYLNARLRARLDSFIQPRELRRLSGGTIRDLELFLLESAYAESYRAHLVAVEASPLARIEMAVSIGVADRIRNTVNLAQGEPRELMKVVTTRSDLHNSRLVLRGLSLGRDPSRNPSWHGYGELEADFFDSLWSANTTLDAREKCLANGTPLALALGDALEVRQEGESLPLAERQLLNAFLSYQEGLFRKIGGAGSETAIEVLGRSVDLWNIGIWFRKHRGDRGKAQEAIAFLPYGKWLEIPRLESSDSVRAMLETTPWTKGIEASVLQAGSATSLQGELNRAFWKWQSFLYRRNLLGFEVAVSFLARLLMEWQNLNILAVGLALGHPGKEISRRIVDVVGEEERPS